MNYVSIVSSVSIVNFEHVIAGCVTPNQQVIQSLKQRKTPIGIVSVSLKLTLDRYLPIVQHQNNTLVSY